MACVHQQASQSILKNFIFVLVIQVKYIDGLAGELDTVENISGSFPEETKATDRWSIRFRLRPVSLGTQCRVQAQGRDFIYQSGCALESVDHFLSCFNTWQFWVFLALCTSVQCLDQLPCCPFGALRLVNLWGQGQNSYL